MKQRFWNVHMFMTLTLGMVWLAMVENKSRRRVAYVLCSSSLDKKGLQHMTGHQSHVVECNHLFARHTLILHASSCQAECLHEEISDTDERMLKSLVG